MNTSSGLYLQPWLNFVERMSQHGEQFVYDHRPDTARH